MRWSIYAEKIKIRAKVQGVLCDLSKNSYLRECELREMCAYRKVINIKLGWFSQQTNIEVHKHGG